MQTRASGAHEYGHLLQLQSAFDAFVAASLQSDMTLEEINIALDKAYINAKNYVNAIPNENATEVGISFLNPFKKI